MNNSDDEFVCEQITPVPGTMLTEGMLAGEPGFPQRFIWRKNEYSLDRVIKQWKESGPCRNGSKERYLRRHWYRILTTDGQEMTIFFERQPASRKAIKKRWWLDTIKRQQDPA